MLAVLAVPCCACCALLCLLCEAQQGTASTIIDRITAEIQAFQAACKRSDRVSRVMQSIVCNQTPASVKGFTATKSLPRFKF